jgi:hypothetical protein
VPTNGGLGCFVRISGTNFGASRGASIVTIGGIVPTVVSWSDHTIIVRLGKASVPGLNLPIVVSVLGHASNNDVAITVDNAHAIFYFDPNIGAPTTSNCTTPHAGTETDPWGYNRVPFSSRSLTYYVNSCMASGDIVYMRGGTIDTRDDRGWSSLVTPSRPATTTFLAMVAYPGETAILDASKISDPDMRTAYRDTGSGASGYVLAGFEIRGVPLTPGGWVIVQAASANARIVGNRLTGPGTCAGTAAIQFGLNESLTSGGAILGNEITDVGTACNGGTGTVKTLHSIYQKCNGCEVAWNNIHDNKTYNGVMSYEDALVNKGGYYNYSIHDNWIDGQFGSAIVIGTADFPTGSEFVKVYNNMMRHNGVANAFGGSAGDPHSCLKFGGVSGGGRADAVGVIEVYNNVCYDSSPYLNSVNSNAACTVWDSGFQPGVTRLMVNNIFSQPGYKYTGSQNPHSCGGITDAQRTALWPGSTSNIWFSATQAGTVGNIPSFGSITDPLMIHPGIGNFKLAPKSPGIERGDASLYSVTDVMGLMRPQVPSIGAYDVVTEESEITVHLLHGGLGSFFIGLLAGALIAIAIWAAYRTMGRRL